jgi:hypothetical protein
MATVNDYRKCFKPDCMRKVSLGSRFCCGSCSAAAEAAAPYEIEPYSPGLHPILCHSKSCDGRAAERGEFTPLEAEAVTLTRW